VTAGIAFHESSTYAEEHRSLKTVVRTPVGAVHINLTIDRRGESPSRLVAVDAQISETGVEGLSALKQDHGFGGLEGEIGRGVGGVDLVTGAAILAGWVWISSLDLIRVEPRSNSRTETCAGVTSCAATATSS
jgi:hypothetical protein